MTNTSFFLYFNAFLQIISDLTPPWDWYLKNLVALVFTKFEIFKGSGIR